MGDYTEKLMEEIEQVLQPKVVALTCDRCHVRYDDQQEIQEFLRYHDRAGYSSIFGDLNELSLDLCQHCVKAVLGNWLRVRVLAERELFGTVNYGGASPATAQPTFGEEVWRQKFQTKAGKGLDVVETADGTIYGVDAETSMIIEFYDSREEGVKTIEEFVCTLNEHDDK